MLQLDSCIIGGEMPVYADEPEAKEVHVVDQRREMCNIDDIH